MKLSLSPITDRLDYAYKHPGRTILRATQDVCALACTYVAYEHISQRRVFPCTCLCATSELHSFGSAIVTATGLMLASVVVWRYNHYSVPKLAIPEGHSER